MTNAATSCGVGGKPVRSSDRRRSSVRRSASGDGVIFSLASRTRTRLSMVARGGGATGKNDQCPSYLPPSPIQRIRSCFCAAVRVLWKPEGGMVPACTSCTSLLARMSPGTTARLGWSRRRPPWRLFLSGPWQAKQLSERIGRMSRLNCTASPRPPPASEGGEATAASPRAARLRTATSAGDENFGSMAVLYRHRPRRMKRRALQGNACLRRQ